jgi:hypothetical protein
MSSARKRQRRTEEYQGIRRVRKAREKCGCETLRTFLLFARQIGRIPKDIDVNKELKKLRGHRVSPPVLAFAEEVHGKPQGFFKSVWESTRSSGRALAV